MTTQMDILRDILKTTIFIPPIAWFTFIGITKMNSLARDLGSLFGVFWVLGTAITYFFVLKPSFLQPSIVDDKGRIIKKQEASDLFSPESPSNDD